MSGCAGAVRLCADPAAGVHEKMGMDPDGWPDDGFSGGHRLFRLPVYCALLPGRPAAVPAGLQRTVPLSQMVGLCSGCCSVGVQHRNLSGIYSNGSVRYAAAFPAEADAGGELGLEGPGKGYFVVCFSVPRVSGPVQPDEQAVPGCDPRDNDELQWP